MKIIKDLSKLYLNNNTVKLYNINLPKTLNVVQDYFHQCRGRNGAAEEWVSVVLLYDGTDRKGR